MSTLDPDTLRSRVVRQIQEAIRKADPPKPSTKVSSDGRDGKEIAARRSTDPRTLARKLRGDLDWIVLKALEKERSRRYETANAFALAQEDYLGEDHPTIARTLTGLAIVLDELGEYEDSGATYEKALGILESAYGPRHVEVAYAVNNLAILRKQTGRFEEALALREKALGPDHVDLASSINALGRLLVEQGKLDEARPLFDRALSIREKALGSDHPMVAVSLEGIADLSEREGNIAEARLLHERALRIRTNAYADNHYLVGVSAHNLAKLDRADQNFQEAEDGFIRAGSILEGSLGKSHPYEAENLKQYADLLRVLSREGLTG